MRLALSVQYATFLGLAIVTCGCSERSNTVQVQGQVIYRGEPLDSAGITFYPQKDRPVTGVVSQGAYAVDLAPGDYDVTITVGSEIPPGFKEGDTVPPPKVALPDEYTLRAKSTLKATVAAGQSEPIDFDLK
jgi:hypothetical protein